MYPIRSLSIKNVIKTILYVAILLHCKITNKKFVKKIIVGKCALAHWEPVIGLNSICIVRPESPAHKGNVAL